VSRAGLFEVFDLARRLKDTREVFAELVRRHGDVVRIRIGPSVFFILAHPDDIQEVLETHADRFRRMAGELRVSRRISGAAVSSTEGPAHARERSVLEPVMYGDAAEISADAVVELSARWRDGLAGSVEVDVWAAMERFCTELVVKMLTGLDPMQGRGRDIVDALIATVAALDALPGGPTALADRVRPIRRRFERERAHLDALVADAIADHRREERGGDILSMLIRARDPEGAQLTDLELRNHLVALYRGHTATSTGLALAWWKLGGEPEAEAAFLHEVDALGDRPVRYADLGGLSFTTRAFQESLRLFPPAWVLARTAVTDHPVGGETMRSGDKVFVSEWLTHRDPRFWDDPEAFRPERFEPERAQDRHPYAYFPQGGGNNLCIGHRMVVPMEAPLILATVAQRWRLKPVPGREPDLAPRATLKPKSGVWLVPEARA